MNAFSHASHLNTVLQVLRYCEVPCCGKTTSSNLTNKKTFPLNNVLLTTKMFVIRIAAAALKRPDSCTGVFRRIYKSNLESILMKFSQ